MANTQQQAPTATDYLVHFYKQKLAAAQDEAAQLFAKGATLQAEKDAAVKRAEEAESKLQEETTE